MIQLDELISILLSHPSIKKSTYNRSDFIFRAGDKDQNIYFIVKGAVRVFYLSKEEEFTIRFGYQNSIITALPTFFYGGNALFYMQTLKQTEVRIIPKIVLDEVLYSQPRLQNAYLQILEDLVAQQMEREIDLLTTSPHDRLIRVLERSPKVFQEIPLKYIASYLRMTPETLSRILKAKS